jgi:hypothetical protein
MGKKPLSFGERLQKKVDQINKTTQDNFNLYAEQCKKQGVKVGEPIDIMGLLGKKK